MQLLISNYLINLQFGAGFYSPVHEFLNIFWLNIKYGAYYGTYIFRFISNYLWNWGGGEGGFHLIAL